ncbi:hypothetical protein [Reticulibacter mediterranei]|uniref:hypothetical protein n=1 Tax=Reticulibacter mediterranei TaxID=2778369 RepID=UPI001C68EBD2|nr:hypothetical protein [Reticulibacter mediterranei]
MDVPIIGASGKCSGEREVLPTRSDKGWLGGPVGALRLSPSSSRFIAACHAARGRGTFESDKRKAPTAPPRHPLSLRVDPTSSDPSPFPLNCRMHQ